MIQLIAEILSVGVILTIVGTIISFIIMYYKSPSETLKFKHWQSVMLGYFVSGMLVHIICEYSGINKLYCNYGVACIKK